MSESATHDPAVAHHFETAEQQHEAASIGIWAFLVQEVMFFGGLFTVYLIYRTRYPGAFAEASTHLPVGWGTLNTGILIGSSLTMALAVRCGQLSQGRKAAGFIGATGVLGLAFLGVKAIEYSHKWHDGFVPGLNWHPPADSDPHLSLFFVLYFVMTGMHAVHMLIGMAIMPIVALKALRGRYTSRNYIGIEFLGLYWHFVDLVWIFLFPLLYLLGFNGAHA